MKSSNYSYIDYISDYFYAHIRNGSFTAKEVRCYSVTARCPITGKRQFLRKCLQLKFKKVGVRVAPFYCELYEFERYLLMNDFPSSGGDVASFRRKMWY